MLSITRQIEIIWAGYMANTLAALSGFSWRGTYLSRPESTHGGRWRDRSNFSQGLSELLEQRCLLLLVLTSACHQEADKRKEQGDHSAVSKRKHYDNTDGSERHHAPPPIRRPSAEAMVAFGSTVREGSCTSAFQSSELLCSPSAIVSCCRGSQHLLGGARAPGRAQPAVQAGTSRCRWLRNPVPMRSAVVQSRGSSCAE